MSVLSRVLLVAILIASHTANSLETTEFNQHQPISATNFEFGAWNLLLEQYVVPGVIDGIVCNMVDYYKIANDANYDKIMTQIGKANTTGFSWPQYQAFWINVYNFAVVRAIVEHPCKQDMFPGGCGPVTSIKQCGIQQPSAYTVIWKMQVAMVAGKAMTLDDIKEKLQRPPAPWQVDPRFHSALCNSAVSAADLASPVPGFPTVDLLDGQLNASMVAWLSNPLKGSIFDKSANELALTEAIKHNEDDWTRNDKSIWWWLHNYGTPEMQAYTRTPSISFFKKYDWKLNGEVGQLCGSGERPCYPWWGLVITVASALLLVVIIIIYCYCVRVLKRKAFRDYVRNMREDQAGVNYERLPS